MNNAVGDITLSGVKKVKSGKVREVAVQYKLDLVHSHYAIPYATSAFLAKEMLKTSQQDLHTITTLHGTDITLVGLMPSLYEITRFSISVSDGITAVSDFLRKDTVRAFKVTKPIAVIHNFVDCNEFRPTRSESVRRRFAEPDEKLIVHVSNFRKVKNIPTVVDVFDNVRRTCKSKLLLVGDGPEAEAIKRMIEERGLDDDVIFLGDRESVADILPLGDVFLLPSEHESFGLAALEAMSSGVVPVTSNIGGLHEVIQEGETGYLRAPHDVDGMSEVVVKLLEDDELRSRIAFKARESAKRDFGKDKIVAEYQSYYESLLNEARG